MIGKSTLIELLATEGPFAHRGGDEGACVFCGNGEATVVSQIASEHDPTCLWRLAVELVGE